MNYAIILSGGIGSRMRNDGFPKQYLKVNEKTILEYTLETFDACEIVNSIIVVIANQWQKQIKGRIVEKINKSLDFALPGESRQESILNGLTKCMETSNDTLDKVVIHDAVRPLVSLSLIRNCLDKLPEYDGCMPVLPVVDTTYFSDDGKHIGRLLDRNKLFSGQAPEAFMLHKYYRLTCESGEDMLKNTRGSSEIAYNAGLNICMIPGEDSNFKLTTPADLERFKATVGRP